MTVLDPERRGENTKQTLHEIVADLLGIDIHEIAEWQINRIRDDGAIDAYIPLSNLNVEGVPTDPANVKRLVKLFNDRAKEIGEGTGQRDPIVVGHVPGDGFYVLDGFHRHEVQRQRSVTYLHATIEPNLTFEQVVQRRLEYANTHPEIEFARQVEWVQSAWDRTPWSEYIPNVLTAFRAFEDDYFFDGTDDVTLIDSLDDVTYENIRNWIAVQCKVWGYTPKEIRDNLTKVDLFNRDLLHLIYKGKGYPPLGRIGLQHVRAILDVYSGETDMHEAVVSIILKYKLTVAQTQEFIKQVERRSPLTGEDLIRASHSINFAEIKNISNSRKKRLGFGVIHSARENESEAMNVQELLKEIKDVLPALQNDAHSRKWSTAETNTALDIAVVFAEIVSKMRSAN